MPWLQLTEMVPDQEEVDKREAEQYQANAEASAAAGEADPTSTAKTTTSKTATKTTAEPQEPIELVEVTRWVEVPHEARVSLPGVAGTSSATFSANGLKKVEFFDQLPKGEEVPETAVIGDSSGILGVIGNDYDAVKELVASGAGTGADSSSVGSSKSSSSS